MSSRASTQTNVLRRLAHGWNIDIDSEPNGSQLVRSSDLERSAPGGSECARCWVLRDRDTRFYLVKRTSGPFFVYITRKQEGYRPYFENYTVDASILDSEIYL